MISRFTTALVAGIALAGLGLASQALANHIGRAGGPGAGGHGRADITEFFAPCPMSTADLTAACAGQKKYYVFYRTGTDGLGPEDGILPAICICPGVVANLCDGVDTGAEDACFPPDPTTLVGTNFPGITSLETSPPSNIHCYQSFGLVICVDFSSP